MNLIVVIGNLTSDCRLNASNNDRSIIKFSIAENRRYKSKDETDKKETNFFDCDFWGDSSRMEKLAPYLKKGLKVYVSGRIFIDKWEGNEGVKRTSVIINVNDLEFLDGPKNSVENQEPSVAKNQDSPVQSTKKKTDRVPVTAGTGGSLPDIPF